LAHAGGRSCFESNSTTPVPSACGHCQLQACPSHHRQRQRASNPCLNVHAAAQNIFIPGSADEGLPALPGAAPETHATRLTHPHIIHRLEIPHFMGFAVLGPPPGPALVRLSLDRPMCATGGVLQREAFSIYGELKFAAEVNNPPTVPCHAAIVCLTQQQLV
jgi:hypothetical protein